MQQCVFIQSLTEEPESAMLVMNLHGSQKRHSISQSTVSEVVEGIDMRSDESLEVL